MKNVDLPKNLKTLEGAAFKECVSLTKIEIPAKLVTATAVGWEDYGPFSLCENLREVTFADGATTVAPHLFKKSGVTMISWADSITSIGDSAFADCESLTSIDLPDSITSIERYAFASCGELKNVDLPKNAEVNEKAFANCENLLFVDVPNTVTKISKNAFSGSEKIVLYCDYDSYATIYAIENNIAFRPSGAFKDNDTLSLNRENTEFRAEINSMSANGYVSMTVTYDIKDMWKGKVSNKRVKILLPPESELNESTLKLDGVLCKDYTFDGDRVLIVPVESDSGTIKLSVKVTKQADITSYAALIATKSEKSSVEIIGIVNEAVSLLTIDAPETVSQNEFQISGIAPAQAIVTINVENSETVTVQASKAGNWTADVELTQPQNYHSYNVSVSCTDSNGTSLTKNSLVSYSEDEAVLNEFKLYYNSGNETVDLLNTNGVKPRVYYAPNTEFVFELKYDHPEQINKVYVTSTRNNEKKYLEATYDESKGAFITSGFFDGTNRNYVPGIIGVEYTKNAEPTKVTTTVDWDEVIEPVYKEHIDEIAEVKESTEFDNVTTIDLSGVYSDLSDVVLDAAISIYDEKTHGDLSTWLGLFKEADKMTSYMLPGENGELYICTLDYSDPYTYMMLVRDVSGNKFIKLAIDSKIKNTASDMDALSLIEISNRLSAVNTIAGILYKQHSIETDMDKLRDEVLSTSYASEEQRQAALKQVDALEHDQSWFTLITTVLPIIVASTPVALGATMAAPAILFSALLGVFTSVAPMFWEIRTNQIKGNNVRLNFVVDPSGYVYDIDTLERLENVKATAYCIEYDDSVNFWENKPKDTEYGQKWNAADYDQENPQYTNSEGKYAWDVPEGWWRVKFERDGYETTWSEWMTVPPIQTEVNIGMKKIPHKHCFGGWTIVNVATCIDKGLEVRTCECGETETRTVASLGHDYKNGVCTRCGAKDPDYKPPVNPFVDVSESSVYYDAILWAYYHEPQQITGGYTATEFCPGNPCTRGQVVTFLWRAAGCPEPTGNINVFNDASSIAAPYQKAVAWAVEKGITTGFADGTFRPNDSVTRAQFVTFLWRYENKPATSGSIAGFTDASSIAGPYQQAVAWAVEKGVTTGYGDDTFRPNATCTRWAVVLFMYRDMA